MKNKNEVVVEGVALNTKHFAGMSQEDFQKEAAKHKHWWEGAENRDAIVADAYSQLNPAPETDGAAAGGANEGGDGGQETPEAPGKSGRSKK